MFQQAEKRLGLLDANQGTQRRQVQLKTCADVYDHWRAYKRLYKKAPRDGIQFQVDYIDTGLAMQPDQLAEAPVCLALHGAPGSYHDFSLLINHLARQQVRVIAPNFPEYVATVRTKALFRHSADEKAAYLRDFLAAIQVSRIDLLVSHSSAIFPTLLILLNANKRAVEAGKALGKDATSSETDDNNNNNDDGDGDDVNKPPPTSNNSNSSNNNTKRRQQVQVTFSEPIEVRSVVLFNPAGHRLPKSMKPEWFKCGSCRIYRHNWGRSVFRKLGPGFLTVVGVPVRVDNMDNVMLSATVMRNSRCERLADQLRQLAELGLPTLLVFSENDKLIEREIFYEMTQFMRLDPTHFDVFSDEGAIELARWRRDLWIRVMVFKAGGHYAYSNYANTVNKAVSELLGRVLDRPLSEAPVAASH